MYMYVLIYPSIEHYIFSYSINQSSEEARVSYRYILSVSCELLCINWNAIRCACIIQAAFERGLSTSWWMQTESA